MRTRRGQRASLSDLEAAEASKTVRVFISHSGKDLWVARQIAAEVRRCGATTFLDEAAIARGDDFDDEILKAEEQCSELFPADAMVARSPLHLVGDWLLSEEPEAHRRRIVRS